MKDKAANVSDTMAIVGFGRAGQAIARYLQQIGARLFISDLRNYKELSRQEQKLIDNCGAEFEGGGHTGGFLSEVEIIVVSPGVDYHHPALEQARQSGCTVIGELALAADKLRSPVIAVTGTNGKTTVTELIGSLFAAAGKHVFVGGNIGTPIGEYLLASDDYDAVVLEVSSFQLESGGDFIPEVGILLNITPDHLDRHKTLQNYAAAKMRLFQGGSARTFSIINGDDPLCRRFSDSMTGVSWQRFGSDHHFEATLADSRIEISGASVRTYELAGSKLCSLSGVMNSAAALLGVGPFALDPDRLQQALLEFEPGAHRMQPVGVYGGISYINDSKATNTGAVNNAIRQVGDRIVLIAGGRDKGDDYSLLRSNVAACVKRLILIGEAAREIGEVLGDLAPTDYPSSLEDAVVQAAAAAEPGDTVLLSPACASFDMFRDYRHRGDCFIEAVHRLEGKAPAEVQA